MNVKNPEEKKSCNLKVRVTEAEKEELKLYCDRYGLNMSELIRSLIQNKMRQEVKK